MAPSDIPHAPHALDLAAGEVTLLLTDVVDSTQLTARLGDAAMSALWTEHDLVARELLRRWRGREIDKSDGFLLLFAQPADAVGYALDYHRALRALPTPLAARAGIHHGALTVRPIASEHVALGAKPYEVEGLAKPLAARIMALAHGGQTLLSAAANARLAAQPGELHLRSHGHWRFKGFDDPVEVVELGDDAAPFTPPAAGAKAYRVQRCDDGLWQPIEPPRHGLPAERDGFVGRRADLAALARRFDAGTRLVSLLGIGGTGKTRLALRHAWSWLGDHPGGSWFCDLSAARGVDGIVAAVAAGLDVPLGGAEPVDALGRAIAARGECLIVLDNFEQVARHAEATLGRWLERAPQARFIVTTREVLGIVGEQTLSLAPLADGDARELFAQRATDAGGILGPGDTDPVAALVAMLDGLPLAIELAAARTRSMSPRQMLARMRDRFALLGTRAGRHDRQATLRAAFDWSWELLSAPERAALAQLSVFRGGFTLEAAEAVVTLPDAPDEPIAEVIFALVDKSLVRRGSAGAERFEMLESVREYAAERLRQQTATSPDPDATAAAEARHAAHFATLGDDVWSPAATVQAQQELENLFAACRRACAHGDADKAARALSGVWLAIRTRGPLRAALTLATQVRDAATGHRVASAVASLVRGLAGELCGSVADAERDLSEAAALASEFTLAETELRARQRLASLLVRRGDAVESQKQLERALAISDRLGQPAARGAVLMSLGELHDRLGEASKAQQRYAEALELARTHGQRPLEGAATQNLAQSLATHGKRDDALAHYRRAVQLATQDGVRRLEAESRCNLGLLLAEMEQHDDAVEELRRSVELAVELDYMPLQAVAWCNTGLVHEARGDATAALDAHNAALNAARQSGDGRFAALCEVYRARALARLGDHAAARSALDAALGPLQSAGDRFGLALRACAQAQALRLSGRADESREALADAERLCREAGAEAGTELADALAMARHAPVAVL